MLKVQRYNVTAVYRARCQILLDSATTTPHLQFTVSIHEIKSR